jgi:hypothetical protein
MSLNQYKRYNKKKSQQKAVSLWHIGSMDHEKLASSRINMDDCPILLASDRNKKNGEQRKRIHNPQSEDVESDGIEKSPGEMKKLKRVGDPDMVEMRMAMANGEIDHHGGKKESKSNKASHRQSILLLEPFLVIPSDKIPATPSAKLEYKSTNQSTSHPSFKKSCRKSFKHRKRIKVSHSRGRIERGKV